MLDIISLIVKYQDRKCRYKRKIVARSRNHCCSGKAITITYSECVYVALVIQHAMRMCHFILTFAACLCVPYFFHITS
jgi:hypothetical protein